MHFAGYYSCGFAGCQLFCGILTARIGKVTKPISLVIEASEEIKTAVLNAKRTFAVRVSSNRRVCSTEKLSERQDAGLNGSLYLWIVRTYVRDTLAFWSLMDRESDLLSSSGLGLSPSYST